MAEGDTVLRWTRNLAAAFEGRQIVAAEAPHPRSPLRRKVARMIGLELGRAESRGKHLILDFKGGMALHSHMGMNGSWGVYEPGQKWRYPKRSAWLALALGGIDVVQFGGPTLRLVRTVELGRDSRLASLGPDLLAPDFDVGEVAGALAGSGRWNSVRLCSISAGFPGSETSIKPKPASRPG